MLKTIATLISALVIAAAGFLLARYAEADDSPGGVIIGWLLVAGAIAVVVKAFLRKDRKLGSDQG
jgi:hypothetical protein